LNTEFQYQVNLICFCYCKFNLFVLLLWT
jgi:hypothetical protein